MKFREDFVTNSSSSSYITVYKFNEAEGTEDLSRRLAVDFGKFGLKQIKAAAMAGDSLLAWFNDCYIGDLQEAKEVIEEEFPGLNPKETYIVCSRVLYTNEGDTSDPISIILDDEEFGKYFEEVFRYGEEY